MYQISPTQTICQPARRGQKVKLNFVFIRFIEYFFQIYLLNQLHYRHVRTNKQAIEPFYYNVLIILLKLLNTL
jgi:hypothetical protein